MALWQQVARYWHLATHLATVGDVSSAGKGLSKYLHLSGTRWFPSLTDPLAGRSHSAMVTGDLHLHTAVTVSDKDKLEKKR